MPETGLTIRRLSLFFIAFHVLVAILIGIGVYRLADTVLSGEQDERLAAESAYLIIAYERGGADLLKTVLRARDDRGVNSLGYLLVDRGGRQIGGELRTAPPEPGWSDISFIDSEGRPNVAQSLTRTLSDGSRLTVAVETAWPQRLLNTSMAILLGGLAVMLAGGIIGTVLFSRIIRRRLAAMNGTALAIIAGDTQKRVPEEGDDEFSQLAVTLNRMLDRTGNLIESLRQVSSDIAHDLRTPISRLRRKLEKARDHAESGHDPLPEIEAGIARTDEILTLFSALLRIAEVESGALQKYFTRFDLSEAVRTTCEIYAAVAEDAGRHLSCAITPDLFITGDRDLICQALINILENSLRHTPPGTCVTVSLTLQGTSARLSVFDNGPGVPEHQLDTLTSRFTRGSRDRGTPGYGLGLNNVRAIAAAHDAALTIRNADPGFEVSLLAPLTN